MMITQLTADTHMSVTKMLQFIKINAISRERNEDQ